MKANSSALLVASISGTSWVDVVTLQPQASSSQVLEPECCAMALLSVQYIPALARDIPTDDDAWFVPFGS
jgi:hypothetical protein